MLMPLAELIFGERFLETDPTLNHKVQPDVVGAALANRSE